MDSVKLVTPYGESSWEFSACEFPTGIEVVAKDGSPADERAEVWGVWLPEDVQRLYRYLSTIVLPPVERIDDNYGLRHTSGTSVVYVNPYGITPRSQASTPEEARALAACLLAAADEAEAINEAEGTVEQ